MQPCRGYGHFLVIVVVPVVWKFTLNTKFLCISRSPSLNNEAIISVVFNKMEKTQHYDMWEII
jgi:hypothetical protein